MTTTDSSDFIEYRNILKNNFMFFRMFLKDDVDAIIAYFISTGELSYTDLTKIYDGLYAAFIKIVETYPNKTAKSLDSVIKLPKNSKNNLSVNSLNHQIVFQVSKILIFLLAATSTLLSDLDNAD